MSEPIGVMITVAPKDPAEKKEWVSAMVRLQIAMWVDGKLACPECKAVFLSVDDFLRRKVKCGVATPPGYEFVDEKCFPAYAAKHGLDR